MELNFLLKNPAYFWSFLCILLIKGPEVETTSQNVTRTEMVPEVIESFPVSFNLSIGWVGIPIEQRNVLKSEIIKRVSKWTGLAESRIPIDNITIEVENMRVVIGVLIHRLDGDPLFTEYIDAFTYAANNGDFFIIFDGKKLTKTATIATFLPGM